MRKRQVLLAGQLPMSRERATRLANVANGFSSGILLEFGQTTINAKSLLGYLSLGAMHNREMTLSTQGDDENEAMEAMCLALQGE